MVKNIEQYKDTIPAVKDAAGLKETFWLNPKRCPPRKMEYSCCVDRRYCRC